MSKPLTYEQAEKIAAAILSNLAVPVSSLGALPSDKPSRKRGRPAKVTNEEVVEDQGEFDMAWMHMGREKSWSDDL